MIDLEELEIADHFLHLLFTQLVHVFLLEIVHRVYGKVHDPVLLLVQRVVTFFHFLLNSLSEFKLFSNLVGALDQVGEDRELRCANLDHHVIDIWRFISLLIDSLHQVPVVHQINRVVKVVKT